MTFTQCYEKPIPRCSTQVSITSLTSAYPRHPRHTPRSSGKYIRKKQPPLHPSPCPLSTFVLTLPVRLSGRPHCNGILRHRVVYHAGLEGLTEERGWGNLNLLHRENGFWLDPIQPYCLPTSSTSAYSIWSLANGLGFPLRPLDNPSDMTGE